MVRSVEQAVTLPVSWQDATRGVGAIWNRPFRYRGASGCFDLLDFPVGYNDGLTREDQSCTKG